jgi:hypothetical protein
MGTIHHTAIVVTGADYTSGPKKEHNLLTKAHRKAPELFGRKQVSTLKGTGMNGYMSFLITPSGSKLGWNEACKHEEAMEQMVEFLDSIRYEDGSTSVKYVKVSFGELGLQVSDWRGNELEAEDS